VLRALAASSVVVGHVAKWPWAYAGATGPLGALWRLLQQGIGTWGVDVFFVLSGLCIHLPIARRLARGEAPTLEVAPYFKRRLFRIYPPHALVIGLSWLAAATLTLPAGYENYLTVPTAGQFWAHVFMVHTFVPGATYSINSVLWTIAIESHFYLVYPLLLLARRRFSMGALCVGLFGLMLALRGFDTVAPAALRGVLTYNFPGRLWEWVLGAVIAERLARAPFRALPRLPVLAAAVVAALAFCWGQGLPHGVAIVAILSPFVSAVLVFWAARMGTSESRWLDRALVAVGYRSYSLYLTHPITLVAVAMLAGRGLLTRPWAQVLVSLAASYGGAWLYFALVERRFLVKSAGAAAPAPAPAVASPGG
jgi:peptidoglycan/LPS O-acetylase OafA/YrhL